MPKLIWYCFTNKISGARAPIAMGWDTLERRAPGYSGRAAAARTQTVWRPGAQALKLDRLQAIRYKIL